MSYERSRPVARLTLALGVLITCTLATSVATQQQSTEMSSPEESEGMEEMLAELKIVMSGPQPTGINDPTRTNAEINEYVAESIFSKDTEKVEKMLDELFYFCVFVRHNHELQGLPLVQRALHEIPGLKEFLLLRWRNVVEEIGDLGRGVWHSDQVEPGKHIETIRASIKRKTIPTILAVIFPGDDDTLATIWESHDPIHPGSTIGLLDLGGFTTPESVALRIETLMAENETVPYPRSAAIGLGKCRTDAGLEALVVKLGDPDIGIALRSVVIEAIVAHGPKALTYAEELRNGGLRYGITTKTVLPRPEPPNIVTTLSEEWSRYRIYTALRSLERLESVGFE